MNSSKSLFQPAATAQRHLKVLLHGGPGTGKTRAALSFPGPLAVLDLEGGTTLYSGDFQVLRTKDIRLIERAIDQLAGGGYATVVIDPLTVLWHLLQDAGQALVDRRKDADSLQTGQALSPREWGLIKRKYNSLLTRLVNLPMHVVLIARDTDLYEGTGDQLKRIGTKADAEKGTPYLADFVLSLQTEPGPKGQDAFSAIVEKSRSELLPKGRKLTGYGTDAAHGLYALCLASLTQAYSGGTDAALDDDAAVAAGNAGTLEGLNPPSDRPPAQASASARPPAQESAQGRTAPATNGATGVLRAVEASTHENAPVPRVTRDQLAALKPLIAALGWGDDDKIEYLHPYHATQFSQLTAAEADACIADLTPRAAHVQAVAV